MHANVPVRGLALKGVSIAAGIDSVNGNNPPCDDNHLDVERPVCNSAAFGDTPAAYRTRDGLKATVCLFIGDVAGEASLVLLNGMAGGNESCFSHG